MVVETAMNDNKKLNFFFFASCTDSFKLNCRALIEASASVSSILYSIKQVGKIHIK